MTFDLDERPRTVDFDQVSERSLQPIIDHLGAIDVELGEDRLVERSPSLPAHRLVEAVGSFKGAKCAVDHLDSGSQILGRIAETVFDAVSLVRDLLQPGLDLTLRQFAVRSHVEQVLFLSIEAGKFGARLLVVQSTCRLSSSRTSPRLARTSSTGVQASPVGQEVLPTRIEANVVTHDPSV
ncbi:MAG: hypothetical protein KF906_11955 [Actinobacteria bacterium]|nr:hypothetical protein [Actinomycetota bacterium]